MPACSPMRETVGSAQTVFQESLVCRFHQVAPADFLDAGLHV